MGLVMLNVTASATYAVNVQISAPRITERKSICGTCCINVMTCMFICSTGPSSYHTGVPVRPRNQLVKVYRNKMFGMSVFIVSFL